MLNLGLGINKILYYGISNQYNAITTAYINRTTAAGFTLEALDCVNDATNNFN